MERPSPPGRRRRKLKWVEFVKSGGETPDDYFIVCLPRLPQDRWEEMENALSALVATFNEKTPKGLIHSTSYAGATLELPRRYRDAAYAVMDAALKAGFSIFTQTRMPVNISPRDLAIFRGETLTPEVLERCHVRNVRANLDDLTRWRGHGIADAIRLLTEFNSFVFSHPASWCTDEGRAFVTFMLAETAPRPIGNPNSSDEEVADDAPTPIVAHEPMELDEDATCVVCLERRADTLVTPCMHVHVCRACSETLKATPNAKRCVYCRESIDTIYIDYA
jgi:hypothetical protein